MLTKLIGLQEQLGIDMGTGELDCMVANSKRNGVKKFKGLLLRLLFIISEEKETTDCSNHSYNQIGNC